MRLALFQPDIPQNLGAALRLGACFGVEIAVIEPCAFPMSDKTLKRAALDYGARARVARFDGWDAFEADRRARRSRLILIETGGPAAVHGFAYRGDDTLLVGRESAGVTGAVRAAADAHLTIPMAAGARSLNVVVAGAIALAEALRAIDGFPR